MGYYSFYKIFKDIIKTLFGNKILRFVIIVGLIVLGLSIKNTVFGANANTYFAITDNNGRTIEIPEWIKNYNYSYLLSSNGTVNTVNIYILNDGVENLVYTLNGNLYKITTRPVTRFGISYSSNSSQTTITISTTESDAFSRFKFTSSSQILQEDKFIFDDCYEKDMNFNIVDSNGNILIPFLKPPEIATTLEDLQTLNFDVISVNAWSYSNEDIDVLFYDLNYGTDTTDGLYPKTVITLSKDTTYYQADLTADPDKNAIYWIPNTETGLTFFKGGKYGIKIAKRNYGIPRRWGISWR